MAKNLLIILVAWILTSCSKYEYWDISQFNIEDNALEQNEKVRVIYSSGAPDDNADWEYFIHVIVVSEESGDTVNVLTLFDHGFVKEDSTKTFVFHHRDPIIDVAMDSDIDELQDIDLHDLEETKIKEVDKVLRNPEYDFIAKNTFPAIIGYIGLSDYRYKK